MALPNILKLLADGPVIPAARDFQNFKQALTESTAPTVFVLFGDINILPDLLGEAKKYHKRLLFHLDLIEGIGKDRPGIKYLARLGVTAIATTKPQLGKFAKEEGMIVVQRLFLMDSEALHTGIQLVRSLKPDAIEVLPATIPAGIVQELCNATNLPVLAGGLVRTEEDVRQAIANGICAISTSKRELWTINKA